MAHRMGMPTATWMSWGRSTACPKGNSMVLMRAMPVPLEEKRNKCYWLRIVGQRRSVAENSQLHRHTAAVTYFLLEGQSSIRMRDKTSLRFGIRPLSCCLILPVFYQLMVWYHMYFAERRRDENIIGDERVFRVCFVRRDFPPARFSCM